MAIESNSSVVAMYIATLCRGGVAVFGKAKNGLLPAILTGLSNYAESFKFFWISASLFADFLSRVRTAERHGIPSCSATTPRPTERRHPNCEQDGFAVSRLHSGGRK
jgi:hypothetical protein